MGFGTAGRFVRGFGTGDRIRAARPCWPARLSRLVLISYGATRRDRTGDLLITKNIRRLQTLH